MRRIPAQAFLHLKHDVPMDVVEDEMMMSSFAVARDYSACVASLAGSHRHARDQRNFLPNALQLEMVDESRECDLKKIEILSILIILGEISLT